MADPETLDAAAIASIRRGIQMFPQHWRDLVDEHIGRGCEWKFGEDISVVCVTHMVTILPSPEKVDFPVTPEFNDHMEKETERIHTVTDYLERGEMPPEGLI